MSPAARSGTILGRLPRHLDANQPGKLIGAVVDALASELDAATTDLGRIRSSRRLAEAAESVDLLRLGALHGVEGHAVELIRLTLGAAAEIRRLATDATVTDVRAGEAFAALFDAVGIPAGSFPRWGTETDDRAARRRLATAIAPVTTYATMLALLRTSIERLVALHRAGNGSVGALLGAAANALQLDVVAVRHSADRYIHVARCNPRLRITRPAQPAASEPPTVPLRLAVDELVIEENPLTPVTFPPAPLPPVPVRHGGVVLVPQRGFEAVPVTVRVIGIDGRTVWPMVVNVDAGLGLAFAGSLTDGQELVFAAGETTTSASVPGNPAAPSQCFSFRGGVFADADFSHGKDFVFDADAGGTPPQRENVASFAETSPPGAFDKDSLPAGAGDLPLVVMPPGAARWALFVGAGTFGADGEAGAVDLAAPRLLAARFGDSVFDPSVAPAPDVGRLRFEWREHEPYAAVVWIPARLKALDRPGEPTVADRVGKLLERHRAAGVSVDVRYADDALAKRLPMEPPAKVQG